MVSRGNWLAMGAGLLVFAAAFALYAPSIGYDFINLDDLDYVAKNPVVSNGFSWAALKAAWTTAPETCWAPLLWMSFMGDVELHGLEPWGFHLTNVLLFALNAGLWFWLARRWTGRAGLALAATLLWALHPMRVESVAWVAERKDVLSGLFFLLGVGAYVEGRRGNLRCGVVWAWACMALGGAVKQVVIVMPAVLILLDVWPLGRTEWSRIGRDGWRLAGEKWAFWMLALALAVLPIWLHQQDGALVAVSIPRRLAMLPIHYLFYFHKLVWPTGLSVLQGDLPFQWWTFAAGVGILGGATWGLWRVRREAPWALMGWLWFVGTLFPLSGVVWFGAQRVADRFTYLPHIGLMLAVALGADRWIRGRRWGGRWGAVACVAVVAVWGGLTTRQLPQWKNSHILYARVLQVNPNSGLAFDNLGQACLVDGKLAEWQGFLEDYRRGHPGNPLAEIHYAWWMAGMLGDADASVNVLEHLVGLSPNHPDFWTWVEDKSEGGKLLGSWRDTAGICLRQQGDLERMEALRAFWEGKWDDRTRSNFLTEMWLARWMGGRDSEGEGLSAKLDSGCGAPGSKEETLGRFLSRWQEGARGYAFVGFREYAKRMPDDGMALNNMAWAVATAKPDGLRHARMDEWAGLAVAWAERALALSSGGMAGVWDTLGAARANAGDFGGAVAAGEQAVERARSVGDWRLASSAQEHLAAYREGRPWRE